jgi:hypothetical protein
MFQCISMCLNYLIVFIDIVIGISPSNSHCNIFAMRIHVHICFSLTTMTTFLTCYTTTFFSSIPIDLFQLSYNLKKNYISILIFYIYTSLHNPHPTSHIPYCTFDFVTSCVENSEAQVLLNTSN